MKHVVMFVYCDFCHKLPKHPVVKIVVLMVVVCCKKLLTESHHLSHFPYHLPYLAVSLVPSAPFNVHFFAFVHVRFLKSVFKFQLYSATLHTDLVIFKWHITII